MSSIVKRAFLIGVEEYQHTRISSVKFAVDDVAALAAALTGVGFESADQQILTNGEATRATMESRLRAFLQVADPADVVVIFFAGHGVDVEGRSYLTCHDTQLGDMENTCIPLAALLKWIDKAPCKRNVLLLDACHSGLPIDESMRDKQSSFSNGELTEFFQNAEHNIGFAACKSDEKSYSSDRLKHGIWTHHLVEALDGRSPDALVSKRFLTSSSLQNHLAREVPKSLRRDFKSSRIQTPVAFGSLDREFEVADLGDLLEKRRAARVDSAGGLIGAALRGNRAISIRSLSGFEKRKRHTVPSSVDSRSRSWVASISEGEIREEIEGVFSDLQKNFGYKRKDVDVSIEAGDGGIHTPDFGYSVSVVQSEEDPGEAVLSQVIDEITDVRILESDAFQAVFGPWFDHVELQLATPLSLEDIIDRLDAESSPAIRFKYPPDCSSCTLWIDGEDWRVVFETDSIQVHMDKKVTPQVLVSSYQATIQKLLSSSALQLTLPTQA